LALETPFHAKIVHTAAARRRGVWHAGFSFPGALAALIVVLTSISVRGRFNDPDLWWHLKTGELIWKTHSIPRIDIFSFTASGRPWIAQEWLSQVVIYWSYHLGGNTGLMLWLTAMACALVLAGYALSALYSGNIKIAFLGGMVTWLFGTVGLAIRPHLIGYLLFIGELAILHLGRERDRRWFYALPPLFALWINFHSSFVFGFVVLAVVLGCSFLEVEWGLLVSESWNVIKRKTLALATLLSAAALFLNPIGPKLIWYPFDTMFNQPLNLSFVNEWQQPDFGNARGLTLLMVAGLILAVILVRRARLRVDEALLLAMVFYFGVRHGRMVFLFGIVAGPILSRLLADAWHRYEPERDRILTNAVLMLMAAVAVVLAFPDAVNIQKQIEKANPTKAVEFLRRSGLTGRMLNNYGYGGYLIWAAPERKVFIDGRADVYEPAGVMLDYMRFMSLDLDPQSIIEKYKVDYCLVAADDPISKVLPLIPGWRKVYGDAQAVIFSRH
jgi:hypothetical protein